MVTYWCVRVNFDNGDVRWLVELTNGLLGKWTTSPYGAKIFDVEANAQAAAQSIKTRDDVTDTFVDAFEQTTEDR